MASKNKQTGRAKSSKASGSPEVDGLKKQILSLRTELELLRSNFDRSKIPKEFIESQDMCAMFQESYMKVLEELNSLKEGTGASSDAKDLEEKLRKIKQELSDSDRRKKIAEENLDVTKRRLVILEEENKRLKLSSGDNQTSTRKEDSELKDKVQDLTSENDKLRKEIIGMREANTDLKKKVSILHEANESEKKKLEDNAQNHEAEISTLERKIRALEQNVQILTDTNNGKDDHKDALLKQLDEVKTELESEVTMLRKELKSKEGTESTIESLKKELSSKAELESSVENLKKELGSKADAENTIEKLRKELACKADLESTVDNLNKEKVALEITIETLQKETTELQSRVQKLEQASAREDKTGFDEDSSRLRTMIQELQKELEVVKREREQARQDVKQHKNDLHDAFVNIDKKEKEIKNIEKTHKELVERKEKTIDKLRRESSIVDPTGGRPTQEVQDLKKQVELLKEDNAALQNRVSQLSGAKLKEGNPGITDLSDNNRPTKLAERFSECYDNEWTEAFEEQEESCGDEIAAIAYLYKLLLDIYSFCQSLALTHAENLQKACTSLSVITSNSSKIPEMELVQKKLLKDVLRSFANCQVHEVIKNFIDTNKSISGSGSKTTEFIQKAVELCWFMTLQDPPMTIDTAIKPSDSFDTDIFKVYTKKGKHIEYVVWPPLRLHKDGPLVGKGVAQGK